MVLLILFALIIFACSCYMIGTCILNLIGFDSELLAYLIGFLLVIGATILGGTIFGKAFTKADETKKAKLRKTLKVFTIVFSILAVVTFLLNLLTANVSTTIGSFRLFGKTRYAQSTTLIGYGYNGLVLISHLLAWFFIGGSVALKLREPK